MPEKKKKNRTCKDCRKRRKPKDEIKEESEVEDVGEEEFIFDIGLEEETASEAADANDSNGAEDVDDAFPCQEEESCKEIATGGFVLEQIIPDKKKRRPPFFCPLAPKTRYENMTPVDVTNDHQYEAYTKKTVLDHMSALKVTSEPLCRRQPAIIATIGPACMEVKEIEELIEAGMNIARINMAYGDRCCQLNAFRNFKEAVKNFHGRIGMKIPVGLMMDLKGPEIRTGRICHVYACDPENPQILVEKGSLLKLTTDPAYEDKCTPSIIYIDFLDMPKYVRPGMTIFLNDGSIQLFTQEVKETEIVTIVEIPGYLGNYRPVHVPMLPMMPQELTKIDVEDLDLAVDEGVDFIVVSKLHSVNILKDIKSKLIEALLVARKFRERPIMILAKISTFQALREIDEIIAAADGVIIQRGDLGLDIPVEKVYIAQREIIGKCNLANKPVICSTQLIKSMTNRPVIDRSHVFDIGSCIEDGADCVCLTGETAIGAYPADAVEQTHHIIREVLAADGKKYHFKEMNEMLKPPIEPIVAIAMAACMVADKVRASAIISLTTSGKSARIISWFRPRCPVIAVTRFERTARQMHLWRAICPLVYRGPCVKHNWFDNLDLQFQFGITFGKEVGYIKSGDPLVLVSCYGRTAGFTNCLRVVYASTEPGIFLEHPKEFYNNVLMQKICQRTQQKNFCNVYR